MKYIISLIVLLIAVGAGIMIFQNNSPGNTHNENKNSSKQPSGSTSSAVSSTEATVPLPQEKDIIRTYFALIEERRISEAVLSMTQAIVNDDGQKQAWGVQLSAIKSVRILSIDPSMKEEWSGTRHTYKVVLDLMMDPSSATAPIPYYGYENGKNTRWISIVKEGDLWKIEGIATGP